MSEQTEPLSPPLQDTADQPDLPEGWLAVQSMDLDAQGVARKPDGKVVFIDGALPFSGSAPTPTAKEQLGTGQPDGHPPRVLPARAPRLPALWPAWRCLRRLQMQHLDTRAQVAVKQRALEDNLWHLGKVKAETILRPIEGPAWGYRYRARLAMRHVIKRARCWWAFTSARAATWPTWKSAPCCRPTSAPC